MIISEKWGKFLLRKGRAKLEGFINDGEAYYAILSRYDLQRTDHYMVDFEDAYFGGCF